MSKLDDVQKIIARYNSALIAFSGGVDSTFLAKVTSMVLGDRILLVTAASSTYPASELESSKRLAMQLGLQQRIIVSKEIEIPGFAENTPDRCYHCKYDLFSRLVAIARTENLSVVFEGSTINDLADYRPGRKALAELGIVSPLLDAKLEKDEIRAFSLQLHLETATKPSYACLASRFPYGERITPEKLERVGIAEEEIRSCGLRQFRVRSHENCARIEVSPDEMEHAWNLRNRLIEICKKSGYIFVALDLEGYRTGAMNEVLPLKKNATL